ncbi:uncharacterized protein LODBEIA_P45250 [Lodderomyces beijingensis]|uniref:Uncharacterized protein n=1 Tax=Lodderomyces beijingensis TaxID=1775926 RepID=A0ABP0ZQ66_9ASCO
MLNQFNIEDIIRDIEILYTSKDAAEIHTIQDKLQTYQRSREGYEIGRLLLQHDNQTVKYFGALTITVYFNTFGVSKESYLQPFRDISQSIQQLCQDNFQGNLFIIRKLLSCMSLIFIANYKEFDPVLFMLNLESTHTAASTPTSASIDPYLQSLTDSRHLELLVIFLEVLIEDVVKFTNNSPELHHSIYKNIFQHCRALYKYLLLQHANLPLALLSISFDCLNSWIVYCSIAENQSGVRYTEDLEPFIEFTLSTFKTPVDFDKIDVYNKAVSALTEFMDNIPRVLNPFKGPINRILFADNEFGYQFLNAVFTKKNDTEGLIIMEEHQSEVDNMVNMIVTYLTLNLVQITRSLLKDETFKLLQTAIVLTNAPGTPTADENISSQFLNFWDDFANTLIDDADAIEEILAEAETTRMAYNERRDSILMEVAVVYFQKIQKVSGTDTQDFTKFRTLVADTFILFYSVLGKTLIETLCQVVGQNLVNTEAAIYLVYKIISDIQFYDDDDDEGDGDDNVEGNNGKTLELARCIRTIFDRGVLDLVAKLSPTDQQQIPISLLNLMSALPFFYKSPEGNSYLAPSFDFLFKLIHNSGNQQLSLVASRTVFRICKDTEKQLIPFLPQLEMALQEMLRNPAFDSVIRERIMYSYITIVRTLKDPAELGNKIHMILNEIWLHQQQQQQQQQQQNHLNKEMMEDYSVSLLACIKEIGSASVLPEEAEDYLDANQLQYTISYWSQDPLGIRLKILDCLRNFSLDSHLLSSNSIVTEKCCCVLKCGFGEPVPGPFTFGLDSIFSYMNAKLQSRSTSSIYYLHKLLLSTIINKYKEIEVQQVELILQAAFVEKIDAIMSDVDLISSSLEIFSAIIDVKPSLLLPTQVFSACIIPFALDAFEKHEVPTIKSTIKFWNGLVTIKKGRQEDQVFVREMMTREDENGQSLGLRLSQTLQTAFLKSPRSALDYYYPLFTTLIGKYPMDYRKWLLLVSNNLNVGKITLEKCEVQQFASKLMITRGQRMANEVLREYWLKINKLVDYKR